ncbi:hypothetical protein R1flu_000715 [Riccia fluitans]|uniref:Uncharacterized protein n=1 Tax=Riccia fluitans TaxID=41844 RepID=A0ABD1Y1N3_9MARC
MALIPRDLGWNDLVFDPFIGNSIFDPFEDLPGMNKDESKVQVADDGILSISGERTTFKEKVEKQDSF